MPNSRSAPTSASIATPEAPAVNTEIAAYADTGARAIEVTATSIAATIVTTSRMTTNPVTGIIGGDEDRGNSATRWR